MVEVNCNIVQSSPKSCTGQNHVQAGSVTSSAYLPKRMKKDDPSLLGRPVELNTDSASQESIQPW